MPGSLPIPSEEVLSPLILPKFRAKHDFERRFEQDLTHKGRGSCSTPCATLRRLSSCIDFSIPVRPTSGFYHCMPFQNVKSIGCMAFLFTSLLCDRLRLSIAPLR